MSKKPTSRNARRRKTAQSLHLQLSDSINPLTETQKRVFDSDKNQVLLGCAGTGKTFISSYRAYNEIINRQNYGKLIYIRSAVPTRSIGFLPGSESEKVMVYEAPYKEIANELFDRGGTYDDLKSKGIVDFMTTSHVRGITITDAIIIVDECQNMSFHELDSIITRVGNDCKLYFCGDFKQSDNPKESGILQFMKILKKLNNDFDIFEFTEEDIVRSDLVKRYLIEKSRYEESRSKQ